MGEVSKPGDFALLISAIALYQVSLLLFTQLSRAEQGAGNRSEGRPGSLHLSKSTFVPNKAWTVP